MKQDVILVEILQDISSKIVIPGISSIYFDLGLPSKIIQNLIEKDGSVNYKDKYPLIAVQLPARERRGSAFYAAVRIPRIVIATLSEPYQDTLKRYQSGGTFKSVLYPIYYEFLNQLALSPNIIGSDPDMFKHDKVDNPGEQPLAEGINDFVDMIEILNLELILNQIKTC